MTRLRCTRCEYLLDAGRPGDDHGHCKQCGVPDHDVDAFQCVPYVVKGQNSKHRKQTRCESAETSSGEDKRADHLYLSESVKSRWALSKPVERSAQAALSSMDVTIPWTHRISEHGRSRDQRGDDSARD